MHSAADAHRRDVRGKPHNNRGGRHIGKHDHYPQCDSDQERIVGILGIGPTDRRANAMVHILTMARCDCSSVDAGNVGGCPAAGCCLPPRSGLLDASAARSCRGSAGRLHHSIRSDSNAHWPGNDDRDGHHGGWSVGKYHGQYHHCELGLARVPGGRFYCRRQPKSFNVGCVKCGVWARACCRLL